MKNRREVAHGGFDDIFSRKVASVFARLIGYLNDSLLAEMIKVDRNLSVRQGLVIDLVIPDVVHDLDAVKRLIFGLREYRVNHSQAMNKLHCASSGFLEFGEWIGLDHRFRTGRQRKIGWNNRH